MDPQGQLPAYEWNFSDVNPPLHAFAAWSFYKTSKNFTEKVISFSEKYFSKTDHQFYLVDQQERRGWQ